MPLHSYIRSLIFLDHFLYSYEHFVVSEWIFVVSQLFFLLRVDHEQILLVTSTCTAPKILLRA